MWSTTMGIRVKVWLCYWVTGVVLTLGCVSKDTFGGRLKGGSIDVVISVYPFQFGLVVDV